MAEVNFDPTKLLVVIENSVGVIGWDHLKYLCFVCPTYPKCTHIKFIEGINENEDSVHPAVVNFLARKSLPKSSSKRKCHSKEKIPFYPDETLMNVIQSRTYSDGSYLRDSKTTCIHCGEALSSEAIAEQLPVFSKEHIDIVYG